MNPQQATELVGVDVASAHLECELAQTGNHSKDLARLDEPVLAALPQAIEHIDEQLASTVQADSQAKKRSEASRLCPA
jgi:hypothetical protein